MTQQEAQQEARKAALAALLNGASSREANAAYDAVMAKYGYPEEESK
jgi:hypothetical protein